MLLSIQETGLQHFWRDVKLLGHGLVVLFAVVGEPQKRRCVRLRGDKLLEVVVERFMVGFDEDGVDLPVGREALLELVLDHDQVLVDPVEVI